MFHWLIQSQEDFRNRPAVQPDTRAPASLFTPTERAVQGLLKIQDETVESIYI